MPLQIGNTTTLTITLEVSATSERITVVGGTPPVNVRGRNCDDDFGEPDREAADQRPHVHRVLDARARGNDRCHSGPGIQRLFGADLRGAARTIEQHHARRSRQQRDRGRERARDDQPGGGARVPGAHQFLFRRVRQGVRRRRQHRDQERHERDERRRLSVSARPCAERARLLREVRRRGAAGRSPESAVRPAAVRRDPRRADREEQGVLLRLDRTPGRQRQPRRNDRRNDPGPQSDRSWHARYAGVDPARRRLPVRHRHGPVSHQDDAGVRTRRHESVTSAAADASAPTPATRSTRTSSRSAASRRRAAREHSTAATG